MGLVGDVDAAAADVDAAAADGIGGPAEVDPADARCVDVAGGVERVRMEAACADGCDVGPWGAVAVDYLYWCWTVGCGVVA